MDHKKHSSRGFALTVGAWLLCLFLVLSAGPPVAAASSLSNDSAPSLAISKPLLAGEGFSLSQFLKDSVGNRDRMIQLSLIMVLIGLFVIMRR